MLKTTIIYMSNNIKSLLVIYILSLLGSGFIFSLLENVTFFNGFYWAVTTALSIGYGDILPTNLVTKLLFIVMSNIWLLLIIPSIVANIILTSIKNEDAFTDMEQEEIKSNLNYLTARYKVDNNIPFSSLTDKEKDSLEGGQEKYGKLSDIT